MLCFYCSLLILYFICILCSYCCLVDVLNLMMMMMMMMMINQLYANFCNLFVVSYVGENCNVELVIELYLQWSTNRKSQMVYQTAPFSMTFNDL